MIFGVVSNCSVISCQSIGFGARELKLYVFRDFDLQ